MPHVFGVLPTGRPPALVAHSNAGLYLPALAGEREVVAQVFADAALPPPSGDAPLAPAAMRAFLENLADDDGLLPPWTHWWDEGEVASLFPDSAARAMVEAEQQRIPLAYVTSRVHVPPGWAARPAAYLAFGDTYQAERQRAAGWGWPVRTLDGAHLHPLMDPVGVAAALDDLLHQQLGARGG